MFKSIIKLWYGFRAKTGDGSLSWSEEDGAKTAEKSGANDAAAMDGKKSFAFIIGIDKYMSPQFSTLYGAVADAVAFRDFLCDRMHVPVKNIVFLDDGEQKKKRKGIVNGLATKHRIVSTFESHFIENNNIPDSGAAMIFFFAGHGTRVASQDAPDKLVEGICPLDERTGINNGYVHTIPLFFLRSLVVQLAAAKGSNITVILDCCHSGGGTSDVRVALPRSNRLARKPARNNKPSSTIDGESSEKSRNMHRQQSIYNSRLLRNARKVGAKIGIFKWDIGDVPRYAPADTRKLSRKLLSEDSRAEDTAVHYEKWTPSSQTHVWLAACGTGQIAQEEPMSVLESAPSTMGGSTRGRFTKSLIDKLCEVDIRNTTYAELVTSLPSDWENQTPQCYGGNKHCLLFTTEYSKLGRDAVSVESIGCFRVERGLNAGLVSNAKCRVQGRDGVILKDIELEILSVATEDALLKVEGNAILEDSDQCQALWNRLDFNEKSGPRTISFERISTGEWRLGIGRNEDLTKGLGFSTFKGDRHYSTLVVEAVEDDHAALVSTESDDNEPEISGLPFVTVSPQKLSLQRYQCFRIPMGHAVGVCDNTEFAAFDGNNNALGHLVVHSVTGPYSILVPRDLDSFNNHVAVSRRLRAKVSRWNNNSMTLRVYIHPSFPKNYAGVLFTAESGRFIEVDTHKKADIALSLNDTNEIILKRQTSRFPDFPSQNRLVKYNPGLRLCLFEGIAHFIFFLERRQEDSAIPMEQIHVEIDRLEERKSHVELQHDKTWILDKEVRLPSDASARYAFTIYNWFNHDLFPYLFFLDPFEYTIKLWYSPRGEVAPLPKYTSTGSQSHLTIGRDAEKAFRFDLPPGMESKTGFVKLLVSTKPLDIHWIEQESSLLVPPASGTRPPSEVNVFRELLPSLDTWNELTVPLTIKRE